ncbi:MAG: hypothetical protein ACREFP_13965, partial [Acetobacteraceae bacterium]
MCTPDTRAEHDRDDLRHPSDLTDAECKVPAPLLPPPANTGRHRSWRMRELINAIFLTPRQLGWPIVLPHSEMSPELRALP